MTTCSKLKIDTPTSDVPLYIARYHCGLSVSHYVPGFLAQMYTIKMKSALVRVVYLHQSLLSRVTLVTGHTRQPMKMRGNGTSKISHAASLLRTGSRITTRSQVTSWILIYLVTGFCLDSLMLFYRHTFVRL